MSANHQLGINLKVDVISADELTRDLRNKWATLQDAVPELQSPYFCPEFTTTVSAVRRDVRIAVLHVGGSVVGFFPFQRSLLGVGAPVGGPLSDFHGVVCEPDLDFDATALLRSCGLTSWEYTHLLAWQRPLAASQNSCAESHFIDLAGGFESYLDALRQSGSGLPKDVRAKRRKLEKLGTVRFALLELDPAVLSRLLQWKSKQYQRSQLVDVFDFGWTTELIRLIHQTQGENFRGALSALYLNDEPIAIHIGMRSKRVWNWWFPRHDERFDKCSPGILLRLFVAEHAAAQGVTRIDLGIGGEDTYKPRLASGQFLLAQGRIERPSLANSVRRTIQSAEAWARQSSLGNALRVPGRYIKRFQNRMRFH